jgi:hypothetical protein
MTTRNFISIGILALGLISPAAALAAQNVITAEQVAIALSSAGVNTTAKQVVLLTNVVASTSDPALKVESTEQWSDQGMKVRVSCVKSEECLPFFVAIRGSRAQAVPAFVAEHSSIAAIRPKSDSSVLVVSAGSRETLLLEGGHVHIQMSVVCLESGAIGQTIRVTSLDHKQTYLAEISSGQIVRGKLQ